MYSLSKSVVVDLAVIRSYEQFLVINVLLYNMVLSILSLEMHWKALVHHACMYIVSLFQFLLSLGQADMR